MYVLFVLNESPRKYTGTESRQMMKYCHRLSRKRHCIWRRTMIHGQWRHTFYSLTKISTLKKNTLYWSIALQTVLRKGSWYQSSGCCWYKLWINECGVDVSLTWLYKSVCMSMARSRMFWWLAANTGTTASAPAHRRRDLLVRYCRHRLHHHHHHHHWK